VNLDNKRVLERIVNYIRQGEVLFAVTIYSVEILSFLIFQKNCKQIFQRRCMIEAKQFRVQVEELTERHKFK
jgi:hypothetical protein